MKDIEQANLLLTMAEKDLTALKGMTDPQTFADEIFGFHAQQVIEKALKAWLALQGILYPKTHNISFLIQLLKENGNDYALRFEELIEYTAYAVQFRYEGFDVTDTPLDRKKSIQEVSELLQYVQKILQ